MYHGVLGRDIEYRELGLCRNSDNVWELVSDSEDQTRLPENQIVVLLSDLMHCRAELIGIPTDLAGKIDPDALYSMIYSEMLRGTAIFQT